MIGRIALLLALLAAPAAAEDDYQARRAALSGLSLIFGELHHIRRLCAPAREGDYWRDQMKRLIELEEPSFDLREDMVRAFNDGYASAQGRFSDCSRRADDYAAARAGAGEAFVARLTAPLVEAARGADDEGVAVYRGDYPREEGGPP
jgi:uncharacterized protein (TIGR02301 family)